MQGFYNGYSWPQREAFHRERKRLEGLGEFGVLGYFSANRPCEICADPQRSAWHVEDYSRPFLFKPPAVYAVCVICHQRLHKRFTAPHEWSVFLAHVRSGGYGREFTALYSQAQRRAWDTHMQEGCALILPVVRARPNPGAEWWECLGVDAESQTAAWARPRPLRPYPGIDAYRRAIQQLRLTVRELELLAFHANSPHRTATMRQLSVEVLASSNPATAKVFYGALAQKICEQLSWRPDVHEGSERAWLNVIAEDWQVEGGEVQWTMIPALADVCRASMATLMRGCADVV